LIMRLENLKVIKIIDFTLFRKYKLRNLDFLKKKKF
jgi:hypothetical protein